MNRQEKHEWVEENFGDGNEAWVDTEAIYDVIVGQRKILDTILKWCHGNIDSKGCSNIKPFCREVRDLIERGVNI